ncbi:MAG: PqqD family protein [Vulcanimicrobiota bacterium]
MRCLKPNREQIAAKVLDGEAILINLDTGVYYSLDGAGATLWQLVECGCPLEQLGAELAHIYGVSQALVEADLVEVLEQMRQETLVLEGEGDSPYLRPETLSGQYTRPELMIYRDMGDLLALDPPAPRLEQITWTPS